MENKLVIGILDIVEDKLREVGIQIPDDDRDGSADPIVGYQYAELHDRIKEYLEDEGLLQENEAFVRSEKQEEDLRKVCVLTCLHDTRYGISLYGSVHATDEEALAYAERVRKECDVKEYKDEYFNADIDWQTIDVSKLEKVKSVERDLTALDEQIQEAKGMRCAPQKGDHTVKILEER